MDGLGEGPPESSCSSSESSVCSSTILLSGSQELDPITMGQILPKKKGTDPPGRDMVDSWEEQKLHGVFRDQKNCKE